MSSYWTRAGAMAGIAGVGAALATLPMQSASPKSSAPAATVASYAAQHHVALRLTGLLIVISAALLAWFVGTLSWLFQRRDRESPLGAIAMVVSAGMVIFLAWDGLLEVALSFVASQRAGVPTAGISGLYDLENGIVMPGAYGFLVAAFLLTVAIAVFRGLIARNWVGYLCMLFAALSVAGSCLSLSSINGGSSSPVSYAPAIGTSVVMLVLAVGLLRQPDRVRRQITEPSAQPAGA